MTNKISTGLNDRSRDDTIAQSGPGIPDDSSKAVEVSDAEVEQVRSKLKDNARAKLLKEVDEQIDKPQRGSP
jgi:hypothetical protein